jgi:exopolyphosphatase/guanosine-5'-triphosphate,3'-diphosphate pyrophosphatase
MRVAAIDVGSNSIHMVVAQVEADGRFNVLDRAKEMVRLGQRTLTSGRLSADAMNAGVRTLAAFKMLAERQGVLRYNAVATSAVREAKNGGDFVQRVKEEVGLRLKVIPGREEARLTFLGVRHAIDLRAAPALIVDAGGGSVELILVDNDKPVALESFKLGVARLCEEFLDGGRPSAKQLADLEAHFAKHLDGFLERALEHQVRRVIGTSGTMLNLITIAAHERGDAPNGHLNNFAVSPEEIGRVRRLVTKADRDERLHIQGLDAKRVDFIVVAACLADYVLRYLQAEELVACTWALREGVLLDYIARHQKGIEEAELYVEPRHRSVARFARHLGDKGNHASHVARLALQLYDQLEDDLALPAEAREWLEFAALLHDIGHHIGHKDHQRHSYYLIANGELLGFRHEEIQIIALTARYHRKAAPKDTDEDYAALSKADRRTVRALSAVLRIADGLDRSHYGIVHDVAVLRRDDRLTLQLHTTGDDVALEVWEARRRAGLLEEVLGAQADFQIVPEEEASHAHRTASVSR